MSMATGEQQVPAGGQNGWRSLFRVRVKRGSLEAIQFYLFVAPWLVGFLGLTAGPMLYSLFLSFTQFDLFHAPQWVWLENFRHFLLDPYPLSVFWKSLGVTAYFTFLSVPVSIVGSLALALLLNTKIRGVPLYRTLFYLPSLTPGVASALVWIWIFNSRFGLANALLRRLGLSPLNWLTDPYLVIPSFVLMGLWGLGGNTMIIFLAGLQGVPAHLYEAAEIDGANWWRRFWAVTIPQISPTMFFNLVLGIIGSFQVFSSAYMMTGGGPEYATYFMVYYIYEEAFRALHMGRGATLAWILFGVLLVFTLLQFRLSRFWVYYEGGVVE
ncbi:MAG: carbohydrate ABC transporter permease [Candidatus Hermodarchaeota archaeon]